MSAAQVVFDVFAIVVGLLLLGIGGTILLRNRRVVPLLIGLVVTVWGALLAYFGVGALL